MSGVCLSAISPGNIHSPVLEIFKLRNQCFVLLLRPLFLKQISYLLTGDTVKAYQDGLKFLTNTCLRAARTNLKIIIDLRSCERMSMPSVTPHTSAVLY